MTSKLTGVMSLPHNLHRLRPNRIDPEQIRHGPVTYEVLMRAIECSDEKDQSCVLMMIDRIRFARLSFEAFDATQLMIERHVPGSIIAKYLVYCAYDGNNVIELFEALLSLMHAEYYDAILRETLELGENVIRGLSLEDWSQLIAKVVQHYPSNYAIAILRFIKTHTAIKAGQRASQLERETSSIAVAFACRKSDRDKDINDTYTIMQLLCDILSIGHRRNLSTINSIMGDMARKLRAFTFARDTIIVSDSDGRDAPPLKRPTRAYYGVNA